MPDARARGERGGFGAVVAALVRAMKEAMER
jgi:hypothetical protein